MTIGLPLVEHYRARFAEHGDAALATQMSRAGQAFRFEKLFEIADLDGASVLDVGCGLGDMYPALRTRYPAARYQGIDVVPEMVAHAAAKYPEVAFRCHNLLETTLPERFDYVLMSVVFNNAMAESTAFLQLLVERAWAVAGRGLAFNFLSTHVNFAEASMAYHDPVAILDFSLRRLSRRVRLEHHYERCDVAVFVYR
ncbi:MAG: trans-aconitate 2-methyltransferase [Gemmatimonadales bacterium]